MEIRELNVNEIEQVNGGSTAGSIAMGLAGGWASGVAGFAIGGGPVGAVAGFLMGGLISTGYAFATS